jgi:hypothetical protein
MMADSMLQRSSQRLLERKLLETDVSSLLILARLRKPTTNAFHDDGARRLTLTALGTPSEA